MTDLRNYPEQDKEHEVGMHHRIWPYKAYLSLELFPLALKPPF